MVGERRTLNGERLVERDVVRWSWWSLDAQGRIALADGTHIEPRTFDLLGPDGERRHQYGPPWNQTGLDDYFYLSGVYYVRDGALHNATVEVHLRTGALRLVMPRVVLALA